MKNRIHVFVLLALFIAACDGSRLPPLAIAPTISAIPDQDTSANMKSVAIPFTVSGGPGLSFGASSDNQPVVPDDGIDLAVNGNIGSVTVTPVIDTLGDAFITIVVNNRVGLSASTSFLLTVVPQQLSVQQFTRDQFALSKDGEPAPINAIAFAQDADNDDFADLLAQ